MTSRKQKSPLIPMLLGAAVGMLAARLFLPAATPYIRGRKRGTRHALTTLEKVRIGGTDQWILIRSCDIVSNPILLILHGGPGVSEMSLMRRETAALEEHFTVVNWDQRGAGKSYKAGADESRMTIGQFVEDTRELCGFLLQRYGKRKLFLQGRSWGTALGMLTIARYPELFHAYIGISQISNMAESERASYQWTLDEAKHRGDDKAIRELIEMGPPPYTGDWLDKFNTQRKLLAHYGGEVKDNSHGGNLKMLGSVLFGDEYNLKDKVTYNTAVQHSLKLLQPQLMELDLFRSVPRVAVPVFIIEGRHDRVVSTALAAQYYTELQAPFKELIWFENSAHLPDIEERDRFHQIVLERVLPIAD